LFPCPAASLICRFDTAYIPRSANNTSAADKIASRVVVDLSERAIRSAVIAPVNTAPSVKSSDLFKPGADVKSQLGKSDGRWLVLGSAAEALFDRVVLLLGDVVDEVLWRERVDRAIEFQGDERLALGEQQYGHAFGVVR
jgi:hypothetical protein